MLLLLLNMGNLKKLPQICPACSASLKVTALSCESCDTIITGSFELPSLFRLSSEDLQFVLDFVKCSGSLKIMAQQMKLSYPTVRNLLDDIIARIKTNEQISQ